MLTLILISCRWDDSAVLLVPEYLRKFYEFILSCFREFEDQVPSNQKYLIAFSKTEVHLSLLDVPESKNTYAYIYIINNIIYTQLICFVVKFRPTINFLMTSCAQIIYICSYSYKGYQVIIWKEPNGPTGSTSPASASRWLWRQ